MELIKKNDIIECVEDAEQALNILSKKFDDDYVRISKARFHQFKSFILKLNVYEIAVEEFGDIENIPLFCRECQECHHFTPIADYCAFCGSKIHHDCEDSDYEKN